MTLKVYACYTIILIVGILINSVDLINQDINSNIELLTDKTFDLRIKRGKHSPWLVLFTVPKCALCNKTLEVFSNFTQYYNNEDNNLTNFNLSFGKLDCFQSSWTAMRFSILAIPQVLIITNNTYHLLKSNVTEEILEDFIRSPPGEGIAIPPVFTYTVIISKFFELLSQYLERMMSNKGIHWNKNYTVVFVVFAVVLFCIFEYYFINYCCRRKKKTVHLHTN